MPSRRTPCTPKSRLILKNLGWIVLAAAFPAACARRVDHAPKPVPATAAASRTSASPAPVPALARNPPPSPPTPEPAPSRLLPGSRVGTVRAIGPDSRFVLLEAAGPGGAPGVATGQELRCLPADAVGANGPFALVRVSPERRPPFIVADVLSGQPQAGDDVYAVPSHHQAPFSMPASTPSAASLLIPSAALPPTTR